ncbi:MAG: hypothetical protein C3F11_09480 [Methylocystaceae bacterium]|nr:MAG: hypothetical protein C3F11_09480 [Methylocystaceae bacterium]
MNEKLKFRFGEHDRINLRGVAYRSIGTDGDSYIFERLEDALQMRYSIAELNDAFEKRQLAVERGYLSPAQMTAKSHSNVDYLADLAVREQQKMFWRMHFCERFLSLEAAGKASRSDASMTTAIATIQQGLIEEAETSGRRSSAGAADREKGRAGDKIEVRRKPTARTLRVWLKIFEKCGHDIRGLRDRYYRSGNQAPRIHEFTAKIMRKHVVSYADERRMTKKECYKNFCIEIRRENEARQAHGLERIPETSERRFNAEIARLDKFMVEANRSGFEAAKKKFYISTTGPMVERPLQRVEIDEWQVQLHLIIEDRRVFDSLDDSDRAKVERARWHLCVAIDVATKCILGMSIAPTPSSSSVMQTLQMIFRDKDVFARVVGALSSWRQRGLPEGITVDHGSNHLNELRRAANDLRINLEFAPAGIPQLRGTVERVYSTVNLQSISRYTGRSFSNVTDRGDYPAPQRASLTIDEFCVVIVRYVVDEYHNQPHSGLRGETPANCWERLVSKYGVPPPPSAVEMRAVFGLALTRIVGSRGIRVLDIFYQSDALQMYRRAKGDIALEIRVDADDLSAISVRTGDVWISVESVHSFTRGLAVRTWLEARRSLAARFAAEAEIAQPIVDDAITARANIAERAIRATGLGPTNLSVEEIERAERQLRLGLKIAANEDAFSAERRDPLCDGLFPVEQPIAPTAAKDAPAEKPSGWKIED